MKRAVILLLLAVFLFTGCAAEEAIPQEPYSQYVGNTRFDVDPGDQTITANGYVFTYQYTDSGVSITYPNGVVITESYDENGLGHTSWDGPDPELITNAGTQYADGYALLMVVPRQAVEEKGNYIPMIFLGLGFIGLGVWMYAKPETHWYWANGWKFKNAEPSNFALGAIGAAGIFVVIAGIVCILIGIFA